MGEAIGFRTANQNNDATLKKEVDLLKRRVEALERGEGTYQQYLKLKEQFEK